MNPQTFRLLGIAILLSLTLAPVSSAGVRASGDAHATGQLRAKLPAIALGESPLNNPGMPLAAQVDAETRTQKKDTPDQLCFTADEVAMPLREAMLRQCLTNAETLLPHTGPPAHYQIAGERLAVDAAFKLYGDRTLGLEVAHYERNHPLLLESQLRYSTFLGAYMEPNAIALDDAGNVYVAGYTESSDFPTTPGAYDETYETGFVSVLDPTLSTLRYSTFLGGSGQEVLYAIALDGAGNVYVTGRTTSDDFPTTPGAYDETYNGEGEWVSDTFVSVLDPTLSSLSYSTFLGGHGDDRVLAVALDRGGNVYVTGQTRSNSFPIIPGAYDATHDGWSDAFVSMLNPTLSTLRHSTFLGGSGNDKSSAIALDGVGNVYVAGTGSGDFPTTPGAYDGRGGAFVSVLDPALSTLLYSASLGPGSPAAMVLDSVDNVYVTGLTSSGDFPVTSGAYDETHNGGTDAFISVADRRLSALRYSTFLGGSRDEEYSAMALDSAGKVYVMGQTDSNDFPTTIGAYDEIYDEHNAFVSVLETGIMSQPYTVYLPIVLR